VDGGVPSPPDSGIPSPADTGVPFAEDSGADGPLSPDGTDEATMPSAPAGLDPGWVGLRRLSDAEYANTVVDLLGVTLPNGTVFPPNGLSDPTVDGFDNLAAAPAVSTSRYRGYFAAALALAAQAFADPALAARIVTCAPAAPSDTTCDARIVRTFGLRAWRRPLEDDEVDGLVALARAARDGGETFAGSIQRVVAAMLASESFLHRVELDPGADPTQVHALTPHEVASRLSYLLWSTMPDETLFHLASTGALWRPDVLAAQVTRMLDDPRAGGFVRNFAGQWLGFRALDVHEVDDQTFPAWNDDLRRAMRDEAFLYVSELLRPERSLTSLLTDDFHYVDDALAGLYGLPAPGSAGPLVRVEGAPHGRRGYLGLAAFLTVTSNSAATSPTRRGAAILQNLLCVDLGPVPAAATGLAPGTPRQRLATLAKAPECAGCHLQTDDVGLGLENFDAVGQFRAKYAPGDFLDIDPTGALPDGTPFVGLSALADLLQRDPRFLDCAARKALVYALGRPLAAADDGQLAQIHAAWDRGGLTLRGLLGAIVVSDTFRFRRGESP
jgi:hypothetical protein